MAENTPLLRPVAGQHSVVPVGPDARLAFAFDQGDANLTKDGQDLVFTFDDGSKLTLEGFYTHFGDNAQPPTLIVEGNELPGDAFLAALNNPDLMPAAGPTAGPPMGGGTYEDTLLSGVDGVDRLDKLGFDGWGRNTEVREYYQGLVAPEQPDGAFGIAGKSYDMNGVFMGSGIYEDWRPNKHVGDQGMLFGKLDFNFTPSGSTVVDAVYLSGFHAGTTIVIGTPQFDAQGNIANGIVITGPNQAIAFMQSNFDTDGVYVQAPKHSDQDMNISVRIDIHAESSGIHGTVSGFFTIIVDAAADQPFVEATKFDDMALVGHVVVGDGEVKYVDKANGKGFLESEQTVTGKEHVSVTVPFETTIRFEDYLDDSEAHYSLIEVPSVPVGATWSCVDANGNDYPIITGPDGTQYYQIPVSNADIAAGGGAVTVKAGLTVSSESGVLEGFEMKLKTGAMAVEDPGDAELTLENNTSYAFNEDPANFTLDVVDGGLKVTAGWASEGSDNSKHVDGSYNYTGAYAGAAGTGGAPITIEAGLGAGGAAEAITSVTFTYNDSEGSLWYNGNAYRSGDTLTLDAPVAKLTGVEYRPYAGSVSDADVKLGYQVEVKNAAGVTGSYTGSVTVVVDAVADKPWGLSACDEISYSLNGVEGFSHATWESEIGFNVTVSFRDITDGSETHYVLVEAKPGWDGDYPTVTHGGVKYFVIDVNSAVNEALEYGSDAYGGIKVTIGEDVYGNATAQVEVGVNLTLPANGDYKYMEADGSVNIKAGGLAIEGEVAGGIINHGSVSSTGGSDGEYNLGNNVAITLGDVNVKVAVVTTVPQVTISNHEIYENLTPDANFPKGHPMRDNKSDGAKIVLSGLADGENAEITFNFNFNNTAKYGNAGEGTFDSAPAYGHNVMRFEVRDGDGNVIDTYPITWDANSGKWTTGPIEVPGGEDAAFYFMPGYNYNSNDIKITYDMTVTDPASGHVLNWSTEDPDAPMPALIVVVDAVAQAPEFHGNVSAAYENTGGTDAFVSGGKVDLAVKIEYQDFQDGSELHYVLVEAKAGWPAPSSTLIVKDADGVSHDVTVKWSMQMIDGKMYYKAEVPNETIIHHGQTGVHGDGLLEMHIIMQSTSGVPAKVEFQVGGGAYEEKGKLDGEIRWDNNSAFDFQSVGIEFSKVGAISLTGHGWVFENDTPNAHGGVLPVVATDADGKAGGTTFTLNITVGNVVTDFQFTNYDPDKGKLYFNGVEIDPSGKIPGELTDGEKFIFIPAHNYKDNDINLSYSGTITDPRSGDTAVPGGSITILVDAVAQAPADVANGGDVVADWTGDKATVTVQVEARFEDFDGSERHYVLVEQKPNITVAPNDGIFSVRDTDPDSPGQYINYWKVPIQPSDFVGDLATVNVTMVLQGTAWGYYPSQDVKVGALAVETPNDAEFTYHNNFGYTAGGTVGIDWGSGTPPSLDGMRVAPGYENDRPYSHLGDETPRGGEPVHFGSTRTDDDGNIIPTATARVEWDDSRGYFIDDNGVPYTGGNVTLNIAYGPFKFVPTEHSDEDITFIYTTYDAEGNVLVSGATKMIIDAVANKPTGLDEDAFVDYGHPDYTAMGKKDGYGNESTVKIYIAGHFVDNDGSEKHYALVEAQPGWDVPGAEMVYLEGKAYYRVEMEKDNDPTSPTYGEYLTDADGKQYANVVIEVADPTKVGSGGHNLGTGIMAEEQNCGSADNLEIRVDNNVSWALGGNAFIETSFVDSTVSVRPEQAWVYETDPVKNPDGFEVVITSTLGVNDEFLGMTLKAIGAGEFKVTGPGEGTDWEILPNGALVIHNFDAIANIKVNFVPEAYSDANVSFTWEATFTDKSSGDRQAFGGAPTVVVDAVANAPTFTTGVTAESGGEAAYAGEWTNVAMHMTFPDTDGSEVHYAVLEQGAFEGKKSNVWMCDGAFINGELAEIITIFDQAGNPYYAVLIPLSALGPGGAVDVTWKIKAPYADQDVEAYLKMGGIAVETAAATEITLANNWAENIVPTPVRIGRFDTTEVGLGSHGDLVEGAGFVLTLAAPGAGTEEIITQAVLTFEQGGANPGDVIGILHHNGVDYVIHAGVEVTIDFGPGGYNPGIPLNFTLVDEHGNTTYNSNPVTVSAVSTVLDIYLNEQRDFSDTQTFSAQAVADTPSDVLASSDIALLSSGENVVVTVSAKFYDLDGSEKHYALVEALDGWNCNDPYILWDGPDGKTYFRVEVSADIDVNGDVSKAVSLTPANYVVGAHAINLAVGALALEQAAGADNSAGFASGAATVDVTVNDSATLSLVNNNNPPEGVSEGGALSFTLALAAGAQAYTADEVMSVTLSLSGVTGAQTADALVADGWVASGASYIKTFELPAEKSTENISIPVAKDGVLGNTDAENITVSVSGYNLGSLGGNVTVSSDSYTVDIVDSDQGQLALSVNDTGLASGTLSFDLNLKNVADGSSMIATAAITAAFLVDCDDPLWTPTAASAAVTGGVGSVLWTENSGGSGYILHVTLPIGENTVNFTLDATHTGSGNNIIDLAQVLSITPQSVSIGGGGDLPGLDANVAVDGAHPLTFTLVDSEYAAVQDYGIGVEAIGKELVDLATTPGAYQGDGADGAHGKGQVIIGTDGPDTIHATIGNDILVGGGGNDTFVWNSHNVLQDTAGGDSSHDVVKDFSKGDSLRFEDLFGGDKDSFDALLENYMNIAITDNTDGSKTYTVTDGTDTIALNVVDAIATLSVSYKHGDDYFTQNVELQGFNQSGFADPGDDKAAVAFLISEIIQVGGGTS